MGLNLKKKLKKGVDKAFDNPITGALAGGLVMGPVGTAAGATAGLFNSMGGFDPIGQESISPLTEFVQGSTSVVGGAPGLFQALGGRFGPGGRRDSAIELETTPSLADRLDTITSDFASNLEPYQTLGESSATQLSGLLSGDSSIYDNPAFQAQLQEGLRVAQGAAAAGGNALSGGLLRELQQQGQLQALDFYTTQAGLLSGAANIGLTATGQLTNAQLGALNIEGSFASELAQAQSALALGNQRTQAAEDAARLGFIGDIVGVGAGLLSGGALGGGGGGGGTVLGVSDFDVA